MPHDRELLDRLRQLRQAEEARRRQPAPDEPQTDAGEAGEDLSAPPSLASFLKQADAREADPVLSPLTLVDDGIPVLTEVLDAAALEPPASVEPPAVPARPAARPAPAAPRGAADAGQPAPAVVRPRSRPQPITLPHTEMIDDAPIRRLADLPPREPVRPPERVPTAAVPPATPAAASAPPDQASPAAASAPAERPAVVAAPPADAADAALPVDIEVAFERHFLQPQALGQASAPPLQAPSSQQAVAAPSAPAAPPPLEEALSQALTRILGNAILEFQEEARRIAQRYLQETNAARAAEKPAKSGADPV